MTNTFTHPFVKLLSLDIASALGTWLLVAISTCYFMFENSVGLLTLLLTASLFVAFISLWLLTTDLLAKWLTSNRQLLLSAAQFIIVITLYFLVPYTYTAILITLWGTLLPRLVTMRVAVISAPLWSAPLWLIYQFYWQIDHMWITAALFFMFNMFALIMVNTATKEREAKDQTKQLNTQLLVTQNLLSQATKQAEQVRIARNIHDLLGHHLTALTINLQVASRLTEGQAKDKIDTCHSLAKLLLSDVRAAVSEIRENSALDVKASLNALFDNIPDLKVTLQYQNQLNIVDVQTADCIIKSVQESLTNSLKHGYADNFTISLCEVANNIQLEMEDNGRGSKNMRYGNGLTGMRERVMALGGKIIFDTRSTGFSTQLTLPVVRA